MSSKIWDFDETRKTIKDVKRRKFTIWNSGDRVYRENVNNALQQQHQTNTSMCSMVK